MFYKIKDNTIKFLDDFNSPLDNMYNEFKKINKIIFNPEFNQDISNLPTNIEHIEFGKRFNQNIDNLPINIKYIHLKKDFNQPIDFLPINLKVLIIDGYFNQPIDNLPEKLEVLIIGNNFTYNIDNLPDNLWLLAIGYWYDTEEHVLRSGMFLPVEFNMPIKRLPNKLKYFFVHMYHPRKNEIMIKYPEIFVGGKVIIHLDWMEIIF